MVKNMMPALSKTQRDEMRRFKALSNEVRYSIYAWCRKTPRTPTELSRVLNASLSLTCHQMALLKKAGLLKAVRQGNGREQFYQSV